MIMTKVSRIKAKMYRQFRPESMLKTRIGAYELLLPSALSVPYRVKDAQKLFPDANYLLLFGIKYIMYFYILKTSEKMFCKLFCLQRNMYYK